MYISISTLEVLGIFVDNSHGIAAAAVLVEKFSLTNKKKKDKHSSRQSIDFLLVNRS